MATNSTPTTSTNNEEQSFLDVVCSFKATLKSTRFVNFSESILNGKAGNITVSKKPGSIKAICGFLDLIKIDYSKFKGWADLELLDLDGKTSFFVSHCDPAILNVSIMHELCNLCLHNQLEYRIYPSWWAEDKICIVMYRLEVADYLKYNKVS
jgi:hypothetical protein